VTVKLTSLKVDLDREEKGDWIDSPDLPGVKFKVSSLHVPAYQIALGMLEQKWARQFPGKPVPPTVRVPAIGKLLQKHILHGWEGFDEPFTPELAADMMSSYGDRTLIAAVQTAAALVSLDQVEFIEEQEKNSGAPSGTE